MADLTLVIANKAYSSWSLRPWLAMRHAGLAFDEIVVPLKRPETAARIAAYSPTGKVPCLIDGAVTVWESLAIIEYVAERVPDAQLWPEEPAARAHARAISAEMHAGFPQLRNDFTMNIRRTVTGRTPSPAVVVEIARIEALWRETRERFGADGPFLFGRFSAADAMYAPVATRFETYGLPIAEDSRAYVDAILTLPAYLEWREAALAEPWIIEAYEPG